MALCGLGTSAGSGAIAGAVDGSTFAGATALFPVKEGTGGGADSSNSAVTRGGGESGGEVGNACSRCSGVGRYAGGNWTPTMGRGCGTGIFTGKMSGGCIAAAAVTGDGLF